LENHPNIAVANNAPTICAPINPKTSSGLIPEKVSVKERAIVTAGFANEVDEVSLSD
jgi:hypothetical protein